MRNFATDMKWKFFSLAMVFLAVALGAQQFTGRVYMRDDPSAVYLNRVFVTNITTQISTLPDYNGNFTIAAKAGDLVRFTSSVSERKDLKISLENLSRKNNLIELQPAFREIPEVVLKFKPTGDIRKDVLAIKEPEKILKVAEIVGLPEPRGDGYSPQQPVAALKDGGLSFSIETIYDALSGDGERKRRLKDYEITSNEILAIKNYFGEDYFKKLKIPVNLIENFLLFVYKSDNIRTFVDAKNIEATKPYIEKYLPIYLQRIQNSHLSPTNG